MICENCGRLKLRVEDVEDHRIYGYPFTAVIIKHNCRPNELISMKVRRMKKGCGVLFKSGSGIIICGEDRVDGNKFLCKRCLNDVSTRKSE